MYSALCSQHPTLRLTSQAVSDPGLSKILLCLFPFTVEQFSWFFDGFLYYPVSSMRIEYLLCAENCSNLQETTSLNPLMGLGSTFAIPIIQMRKTEK